MSPPPGHPVATTLAVEIPYNFTLIVLESCSRNGPTLGSVLYFYHPTTIQLIEIPLKEHKHTEWTVIVVIEG